MNKRLEDIKNSDYSILKVESDLKRDWEWLIEQAEREVSHSNKINKLHFFLDNNVADLASERCGYHVIDVAIYVIKEQSERVQELNKENKRLEIKNLNYFKDIETLTVQNKRYRELLEKIKEMTRYDDCREAEIYELVSDELEGEE